MDTRFRDRGYGEAMNVGGWELVFAEPKSVVQLPALIHALPLDYK
jgi:hypothetical protein